MTAEGQFPHFSWTLNSYSGSYGDSKENPDHCRTERCGQDRIRYRIPAKLSGLSDLYQCRLDCGRHEPVSTARSCYWRGKVDAKHDARLCETRRELCLRDYIEWEGICSLDPILAGPGLSGRTFFLWLRTPEMAIERVKEGGHDVTEPVIRRRFYAGWNNFQNIYRDLVDDWVVYDSSAITPVPIWSRDSDER